jgi:peroxiredoxin (alkyl hydroperoxide reductase subunit C)
MNSTVLYLLSHPLTSHDRKETATMNQIPQVGQPAPDFTAPAAFPSESANAPLRTVSLADYTGRWLVFFWYPLDFTTVCPTEITALSDRLDEFADRETEILGASTDSVYSHRVWMQMPRERQGIAGLRFPLVADKTGRVARDYGVLLEDDGIALRGLFIVDPEGIIQYAVTHNLNVGRSVDETLRVLEALQSGGLCGSDWKPGQPRL